MQVHSERRLLPYSQQEMFALVADIERYPEFLPWCVGARIRRREGAVVVADLRVRFGVLSETFTSRVTLRAPERIDIGYAHGPLRRMATHWRFAPAPDGSEVEFRTEYEFRSRLLGGVAMRFFQEVAKRMAGAFEARAHALHGAETDKQRISA